MNEHRSGFGVGLWVVGQLVEAMGGTIRVDDAEGGGSVFTVTLPRHVDVVASMSEAHRGELERVPSGIPGLDIILSGGFLKGGLYIIQGPPGTGKTTFGNQVCFRSRRVGWSSALRHPARRVPRAHDAAFGRHVVLRWHRRSRIS